MKFSCSKEKLKKAVGIVSKGVKSKTTLPILENIKIETKGKKVIFSSTDLNLAIEYEMDANITNEGSITIPSKLFESYVMLLEDKEISINSEGGMDLVVSTKKSYTKIKGLSAEDFPIIPIIEKETYFKIKTTDFIKALNKTYFAVSENSTRPAIRGLYFLINSKKEMTIVGTDSYRLAEKKVNIEDAEIVISECIVPISSIVEIMKIFDFEKEYIEIIISKNQIKLFQDNINVISRLIEGQYPDYKRIIPTKYTKELEVEKNTFLNSLKRVNLFAKDNNYNVSLKLNAEENNLEILSLNSEVGEEKIKIEPKSLKTDKNLEIILNAIFIQECLMNSEGTYIKMQLNTKELPVILSDDDKNFLYLIMPIRED